MCQWKFLVFRYSANASARSTLSASETLLTAWDDRSVGVSRSGETLLGALLTGNLPVRTRTLTARRRTPNARRATRFQHRNRWAGYHGRLDRLLRLDAYDLCQQAASRFALPDHRAGHHRLHHLARGDRAGLCLRRSAVGEPGGSGLRQADPGRTRA